MLVFGVNAQGESVVKYCGFTPSVFLHARVPYTVKSPVSVKIHTTLQGWRCCAFRDAVLQILVVTEANVSSCFQKHSNQSAYPDFWPLTSTRLLPSHSVDIFPLLVNPRDCCCGVMKIPVDQQQIVTCNLSGANNHIHSHLNSNSSLILMLSLNFNKSSSPHLSAFSCCDVILCLCLQAIGLEEVADDH